MGPKGLRHYSRGRNTGGNSLAKILFTLVNYSENKFPMAKSFPPPTLDWRSRNSLPCFARTGAAARAEQLS
jgi:hypothetical protein